MTAGDFGISTPSAVIDRRYVGCLSFQHPVSTERFISPENQRSRQELDTKASTVRRRFTTVTRQNLP
jgi:hypothetical protein